jgi:hypothetical protein
MVKANMRSVPTRPRRRHLDRLSGAPAPGLHNRNRLALCQDMFETLAREIATHPQPAPRTRSPEFIVRQFVESHQA